MQNNIMLFLHHKHSAIFSSAIVRKSIIRQNKSYNFIVPFILFLIDFLTIAEEK